MLGNSKHSDLSHTHEMTIQVVIKLGIAVFLLGWTWVGVYLLINFQRFFGTHKDTPSETPGERSFGIAHVFAVWFGGMALGLYYLGR